MKHQNVLVPCTVQRTLQIASAITKRGCVKFPGLGIVPLTLEWGIYKDISLSQNVHFLKYLMLCVWPGLSIALVVLSLNLFGDGLRDATGSAVEAIKECVREMGEIKRTSHCFQEKILKYSVFYQRDCHMLSDINGVDF